MNEYEAFVRNDNLYINMPGGPSWVCSDIGSIDLLTVAPTGSHVAYWCEKGERFRLLDADGAEVWSVRINTDRARAHHVSFSASGDAVAFVDDYDGVCRLRVRHIPTGNVQYFQARPDAENGGEQN